MDKFSKLKSGRRGGGKDKGSKKRPGEGAASRASAAPKSPAQAAGSGQPGNGREKSAGQKPWHLMTPEEIEALPFKSKRLITIRRRHENMKREIEMIREDMESEDEED